MKAKSILLLVAAIVLSVSGVFLWPAIAELRSPSPYMVTLAFRWVGATPFLCFGALLLWMGFFAVDVSDGNPSPLELRKAMLGLKSSRQQWAEGHLVATGNNRIVRAWLFVVISLIMVAPLVWVALTRDSSYRIWAGTLLFPAWRLAIAFYRQQQQSKYGRSFCELERKPTATDGELRVSIWAERSMPAGSEAMVRLRCEKRQYHGTGQHRRYEHTVLWEETQKVAVGAFGMGIQAAFRIPTELPNATDLYENEIRWILTADSKTSGIDYFAEFPLALSR